MLLALSGICSALGQENDSTLLRLLNRRAEAQAQSVKQFAADSSFRFSNQVEQSGITFAHRIVDDAGKNWKPAHYDHGNALAVADVDGDGRTDLYFVTQLGENQLWRNLGQGRFENITSRAGIGLSNQISVAASFADFDNDGDPDLFVTTVRHGNHLFENTGRGEFRDITAAAGLGYSGHSSAGVWLDFDNDGRLDLFVCNVGVYTDQTQGREGYFHALTNGFYGHLYPERTEPSLLYRNLGGNKFQEVSQALQLRDESWTGDATLCDLNGDGFTDLYLVNMQGDDHYYENAAGRRLVEKTSVYFPKTPWGAMGVKVFDYNNDGLPDVFVTDMHSDMTKGQGREALKLLAETEKSKSERWCAQQWTDEFLQGASNNIFGNAFYINRGQGRFEEASDALGLETYWPWGPSVGDLNADGFEDVFVAAGMGHPFRYGINSVLLNDGGRRFFDAEFVLGVEPRAGGKCTKEYFVLRCDDEDKDNPLCQGKHGLVPFHAAVSSRSAAILDLDGDGDLDIVVNDFNARPQILLSDLSERRTLHWIQVRLVGRRANRDGLGATVTVQAEGKRFTRYQDGKSGYLGQSALPLYFGLGKSTRVEQIDVLWPGGRRQRVTQNLSPGRSITIEEDVGR
jgi:hypothetical protein